MANKQRIKKEKKYTFQGRYNDYVPLADKRIGTVPRELWGKIIPRIYEKLSNRIIVDIYEWKIPYGGGYIRIDKNSKNGLFYFYWDRRNNYCRLNNKALRSFRAVRGSYKKKPIGSRGLIRYYFERKNDKKVPDYAVPKRTHAKKFIDEQGW